MKGHVCIQVVANDRRCLNSLIAGGLLILLLQLQMVSGLTRFRWSP